MRYSTPKDSDLQAPLAIAEPVAPLRGQVVSIVSSYGFIRDDQGVSYYFNPGNVDKAQVYGELKVGIVVVFEAKAGPKGMVASKVKTVPMFEGIQVPSKIITLRDGKKLRDGEICNEGSLVCVHSAWHRSPNDAMNELMNVVEIAEANLAFDISIHKKTFSQGNYQYTMHSYSAWCGLYWRSFLTDSEDEAKQSGKNLTHRMEDSALYLEHEAKRLNGVRIKQTSTSPVFFVVFVIVLLLIASSFA